LKPEQRKSIINLLRGEDTGYHDSPYGIQKSLIFQLYILNILANQSLLEQDRIFLIVVLLFVHFKLIQDQIVEATSLGIAAMRLDDDFKNNISKHAQLLFAIRQTVAEIHFFQWGGGGGGGRSLPNFRQNFQISDKPPHLHSKRLFLALL
jgi:hypothetical protein